MTCDEVFEALNSDPIDPEKQRAVDAHLAGCEECRRCKEGLAAFDDAMEHPERYEADPPHVQAAILARAHAKADEFRAARNGGPHKTGPKPTPPRRSSPFLTVFLASSLAACLVILVGGALFVRDRLGHEEGKGHVDPSPDTGPVVTDSSVRRRQ